MIRWSPDAVKTALISAFEIDYLIGGRVGPRGYGSAMPATVGFSASDIDAFEEIDVSDPDKTWSEHKDDRLRAMTRNRRITPAEVSQMEAVLIGTKTQPSWLYGLLKEREGERNVIEAYSVQSAFWSLRGKNFREERFCKRVGWNYETFRTRKERGVKLLSWTLNDLGMSSWVENDVVVQVEPEMPLTYRILDYLKDGPKARNYIIQEACRLNWVKGTNTANVIRGTLTKMLATGQVITTPAGRYRRKD